jgi:hypothetical protein
MAEIETIEENGSKSSICSDGVIEKLFRDDPINRGETEAFENCDYLAFTGVKL